MVPKTLCQYAVSGDAPTVADASTLSVLTEFSFKNQDIGVPQEIEVGFVTGMHIYDTQFEHAKNCFGPVLLFGLRIDTHKVPSSIKQAYKSMHEKAVAGKKDLSIGFLSKAEKREVTELTNRQIQEELAAGKHRKSKMVALMWDFNNRVLICGAASNAVSDELHKIMRDSFNVELDQLTSGCMARQYPGHLAGMRDFEDIRPSAFTDAPSAAIDTANLVDGTEIPIVPWAVKSVDMKDFLGNEFLLWMWWVIEEHEAEIEINKSLISRKGCDSTLKEPIDIMIDRTLNMDCAWEIGGKQTLRGDGPTRLKEAADALVTGKWPRKAGMIIANQDSEQWELTFQADMMILSGIKHPDPDEAQSPREVTVHQIAMVQRIISIMHGLYSCFLKVRMDPEAWPTRREAISKWIKSRNGKRGSNA